MKRETCAESQRVAKEVRGVAGAVRRGCCLGGGGASERAGGPGAGGRPRRRATAWRRPKLELSPERKPASQEGSDLSARAWWRNGTNSSFPSVPPPLFFPSASEKFQTSTQRHFQQPLLQPHHPTPATHQNVSLAHRVQCVGASSHRCGFWGRASTPRALVGGPLWFKPTNVRRLLNFSGVPPQFWLLP